MQRGVQLILLLSAFFVQNLSLASGFHLTLSRRNGRFARHETANLTSLAEVLAGIESIYASTYRDVENNRLVRRWKGRGGVVEDDALLQPLAQQKAWSAEVSVGRPPQKIHFDLDMLAPDFYTVMTTSNLGSRFDTFQSETHINSQEHIHPLCHTPSDVFHLAEPAPRLIFPICHPPKTSALTLLPSGSILGLGPPGPLSRLPNLSLLEQLIEQSLVSEHIWSVTLLDAEVGVLSVGATIVQQVEEAKIRGELELEHFGKSHATKGWIQQEVDKKLELALPESSTTSNHFKWVDVQGANGWWTALMAGVWVNGAKVLKNQPVLFDVQCPFLLAPPLAAGRLYESIPGAARLHPPHDSFFQFPCFNKVNIAFEFGGWNFPVMSNEGTRADALHGPAGGVFSSGKLGDGTGYCVGRVVETRMGLGERWSRSGVQDMWVLGEPFFRGLGVVFDVEKRRIGIRSY